MVVKRGKKSKKGSITDLLFIMIGLFTFGIITLFTFTYVVEIEDQINNNTQIPANAKTAVGTLSNHFSGVIDNSVLVIMVFLTIGSLILAALVRIHPIFIPVYVIALIFIIYLSAVFSNMYEEIAATSQIASQASQMTMLSHVMTYLPFFIGIIGLLIMVIAYKTWKVQSDIYSSNR